MNFNPPSFRQPDQYPDIPKTIDDLFNAYTQRKQQQGIMDQQRGASLIANEGLDVGAVGRGDPNALAMLKQITDRHIEERGRKKDKELAEIGKLNAEAGNVGKKAAGDDEEGLRKELSVLSKPFGEVRDAMGRIRASALNPSAAGDLALIFNYMKVLDPGSTVREGEFATAQNSAGLPEILRAKYNKVISGERLGDDQRKDFVDRAEGLYGSQLSIQKRQEDEYRRLAKNRGANPENVVIDRALPPAQQSGQEEVPLVDASGRNRIGLYQGNKFLGFKGE